MLLRYGVKPYLCIGVAGMPDFDDHIGALSGDEVGADGDRAIDHVVGLRNLRVGRRQ